MVRAIDQLDAQPLADITYAYAPFFSPDSQWIGFFENGNSRRCRSGVDLPSCSAP